MQENNQKSRYSEIYGFFKKTRIIIVKSLILIGMAFMIDLFTEVNYLFTIILVLTALFVGIIAKRKISFSIALVEIATIYVVYYTTLGWNSEILWLAQ